MIKQNQDVKERPFPMTADMAQKAYDGVKLVSRRPMKPQPVDDGNHGEKLVKMALNQHAFTRGCPYGYVGDRLWVQEPYRFEQSSEVESGFDLMEPDGVVYAAKPDSWFSVELNPDEYEKYVVRTDKGKRSMQSGRFMYRSCSRTLLEITDIRVERLQDIDEEQAEKEGCQKILITKEMIDSMYVCSLERYVEKLFGGSHMTAMFEFLLLWESIYGNHEEHGLDANPWVWVIEFKKIWSRA